MRNIYPNYIRRINGSLIPKNKPNRKIYELREMADITAIRIIPMPLPADRPVRYYLTAAKRLLQIYRKERENVQAHFVITYRGKISQTASLLNHFGKTTANKNEIVIMLSHNKGTLCDKEAYALTKMLDFFKEDITDIIWGRETWAPYVARKIDREDEFEVVWNQIVPKSGEVTIDDFKALFKLIYSKK